MVRYATISKVKRPPMSPIVDKTVEHLENSLPLSIEEAHRWRGLLRDDYLDYQYSQSYVKRPAALRVYPSV